MRTPARPRIDVLLPVRGSRRTLPSAVGDLLAQRDVDLRVIAIVDEAGASTAAGADASRDWLAACARRERRLLLLDGPGRGPGPALDAGLAAVETEVFAHMEADDRCPPDRLALLHAARDPRRHAPFEPPAAVVSRAAQFGARTPGMRRYLDWQNALLTDDELAAARFLEIPALHQTGLYDTAAVRGLGGYTPAGPWPLDIDFWLRWFERPGPPPDGRRALRRVHKLPRVLYRWRQHARQSTRAGAAADGTHSLAALRACKAHYLARLHGPRGLQPRRVHLLSTGATLIAWDAALRVAGIEVAHSLAWRAGQPLPAVLRELSPLETHAPLPPRPARTTAASRPLILAVYGMAPAREALRAALRAAGQAADPRAPRTGADLLFAG